MKGKERKLTTSILFVCAVGTILISITKFIFCYASFLCWTKKLIILTRDRSTIRFIETVDTIRMTITPPFRRYTDGVCTSKLAGITDRKVAFVFIRIVTTIVPMIAAFDFVNALFAVRTSKFGQTTCSSI